MGGGIIGVLEGKKVRCELNNRTVIRRRFSSVPPTADKGTKQKTVYIFYTSRCAAAGTVICRVI